MASASVVIVGGGVIGASVAYHLALRGRRDVVVLDRSDGPGRGSTGAATGGFRAQFATPINIRLSLLAREKLLRFRDETGVDPEFLQAGYLWIAETDEEMAALRAGLAVQHAEGLPEAREVDSAEIAQLNPAIRIDGVIGGSFCPTDGFIRPMKVLEGYRAAAERAGVRFEWESPVEGFTRDASGRITAVRTPRGAIACDAVVNAAGAWAGEVAALAGVALPVTPLRRQVAATFPCDLLPADMPMTLFAGDGFHLRVRDGRVLLLWPTPGVPDAPFDTPVDRDWIAAVAVKARRRVPVLRAVGVDGAACWAGLYEMSPDRHTILGAASEIENFFLANGSSGHGVMHAPAIGQLLAEIVIDGSASTLDVSPLAPDRFARGHPIPGSPIL